jgi:hypothetical protein
VDKIFSGILLKSTEFLHLISISHEIPFSEATMRFSRGDRKSPPFRVAKGRAKIPVPTDSLAKLIAASKALDDIFQTSVLIMDLIEDRDLGSIRDKYHFWDRNIGLTLITN